MPDYCPECGAPLPQELNGCQTHFHELLALESRIPGGPGSLSHYLAVATYNLQHPAAFTPEAREDMLAGFEGVLTGELTVEDLRRLTRRGYDGSRQVLRQRGVAPGDPSNAPVPGWPTEWPRTVLHALGAEPDQDSYLASVKEWAESVLETIRSRANRSR